MPVNFYKKDIQFMEPFCESEDRINELVNEYGSENMKKLGP